jgi:hypothetical protein
LKTIAIFTNFSTYSEAYSLNRVVMNQIRMLVDGGYKPIVIVGKYFEPVLDYADPNVVLKRIPDVPVYNEVKMDSTFDQDVLALEKGLEDALQGVDVVLTHDIIYQPACMKHLVAAKRIAKRHPEMRWMHWIHSATSPYTLKDLRPIFVDQYANTISEKFPNSFYIFFNAYSIPRIAQNFQVDDEDVKIVHHPTDIKAFFKIDNDSWDLITRKNILEADVICTYPIRLDRGKQVEKVIKTIASFKELGKTVRLIIGDFHSTGDDKVTYRNDCKQVAKEWKMTDDELIWLSEQKSTWNVEVPYTVISDFMHLSNVFVGASVSESYSLITQEAGLSGVGMILNRDFPPFRDVFGWAPHQIPFSSNIDALTGLDGETTTKVNDEHQFYLDAARILNYELEYNRTLAMKTALRKYRNLNYIFKHELEPLFYFEPIEEGVIVK